MIPELGEEGDLPAGVHAASLREVVERFGKGTRLRVSVASRLERIYGLAVATEHLARFVFFGSFVTAKPSPNDVDVFLLMESAFRVESVSGEARLLFDHGAAQAHFGASIFWLRRPAALGGEDEAAGHWQIKRDGNRRGIIEIVREAP